MPILLCVARSLRHNAGAVQRKVNDVNAHKDAATLDLAYKISGKRLSDEVTDSLRDAIVTGKLAPGARLIETELSEQFGVSRASIRAALHQLATEGLVDAIPRRGNFVVELTEADLEELYTLRLALESLAVERLAKTITAEQILQFEKIIEEMETALAVQNVSLIASLEVQFHALIWRFSNHKRLFRVWEQISNQLKIFVVAADPFVEPQANVPRHRQLLAAIVSGDVSAAREELRRHIINGVRRLSLQGKLHTDALALEMASGLQIDSTVDGALAELRTESAEYNPR